MSIFWNGVKKVWVLLLKLFMDSLKEKVKLFSFVEIFFVQKKISLCFLDNKAIQKLGIYFGMKKCDSLLGL